MVLVLLLLLLLLLHVPPCIFRLRIWATTKPAEGRGRAKELETAECGTVILLF